MKSSESSLKKELSLTVLMVVMSLFFVSGACSLVYQVVWTRKLALLFGVTSHAVSTDKQAFGGPLWLLAGATALCGFCGLAAEVIYTRLLAIVFLGTTYAFTTMLTAFLCGIGLGGAFAALLQRRLHKKNAFPLAGVILGLAAISLLLSLPWLAGLPDRFMEMQRSSGLAWDATLRATFFLAFLTLFPFTFALGVSFPLIIGVGGLWRSSVGSLVGLMNSSNTLGGVAGAIAGGFFLLPLLGSQSSLLLLGSLLIVGALLLIVSAPAVKTTSKGVMALVLLLAFGATFTILPADVNQALNKGYMPQDHQVLYMKEGAEGTVAVSGPADALEGEDRVLWINRVQATTSIERGVKMNRLQGVLPLLFEKECDQVLFMCFGSGITCGTLALSPFERIDAVEISPEVLTVAPYFDKDNLGVLYNPAVSFHIDDGRNFLLRTDRKYDVITFEPMPLALAGVSTFYTSEYYTLCRKHLTPGGMVSQWIPLHSNDPELVRSLVSTFIAAFPEYCAFFVNADLFLLGAEEPLKMHYARAMERLQDPVLAEALVKSGLGDLSEIMSCFLFDKEALDRYAAGARIMGDDRPWAEFMAPRLVYARRVPEAVDTLLPFISNPLDQIVPESITVEERESLEKRHNSRLLDFPALKEYYGGSMLDDKAADAFVASLEVDPNNLNARYYLKTIVLAQGSRFLQWGEFERVVNLCDKALRFMPTDEELKELQKQAELQLNS